jgi:hypothetical protein
MYKKFIKQLFIIKKSKNMFIKIYKLFINKKLSKNCQKIVKKLSKILTKNCQTFNVTKMSKMSKNGGCAKSVKNMVLQNCVFSIFKRVDQSHSVYL